MNKVLLIIVAIISIVSCTYLIESFDESDHDIIQLNKRPLSLVFSHNINGETHPCGCRHFPLGGLPQVAGQMEKIRKKNNLVYVDTGDTLFPSSTLPESVKQSLSFAAENLAKGMEKMGLDYFVPGDQDFAAGWDFLINISKNYKFNFLISNLREGSELKHKKWAMIKNDPQKIFLLGFVNPEVLNVQYKLKFSPVFSALESGIKLLKKNGYDEKNTQHRLVVLSHSGIGFDEQMAKRFPNISWIIGAHTQSFFRFSRDIGSVRIGQVLSRNHYLGEVVFSTSNVSKDKYVVHEIRDELKDFLKPNEFLAFIDAHKAKMKDWQTKEQSQMSHGFEETGEKGKFITALSCLECHSDQGEHWKKTPHALAYATLLNANEYKNLNCIKCHSYGLGVESGFNNAEDIFVVDEEVKNKKQVRDRFLKAYKKTVSSIESSRNLSSKKMGAYTEKILELERKHKITHNFSGVQCMHCHGMDVEHPFEEEGKRSLIKINSASLKNKCLGCHDPDQSPGWYKKNEKGLPGKPNWKIIDQHYQKFSCPK